MSTVVKWSASRPEVVDHAVAVIVEWLGADWVDEQLSKRPKSRGGSLARWLLLRGPVHPLIELLSKADDWKSALAAEKPPPDLPTFFSLLWASRAIELVSGLEGGAEFRDELRDRYVKARVTRSNVAHFWNHLFEAEYALQWASETTDVVLAPAGGNPDVLMRFPHGPAVPVECYRLGDRDDHEEFWRQLQIGIERLCKQKGRIVGVSVRCHRDPSTKDVSELLACLANMIDEGNSSPLGQWIVRSAVGDSYQVCSRIVELKQVSGG